METAFLLQQLSLVLESDWQTGYFEFLIELIVILSLVADKDVVVEKKIDLADLDEVFESDIVHVVKSFQLIFTDVGATEEVFRTGSDVEQGFVLFFLMDFDLVPHRKPPYSNLN